jgi:hypothetical protein
LKHKDGADSQQEPTLPRQYGQSQEEEDAKDRSRSPKTVVLLIDIFAPRMVLCYYKSSILPRLSLGCPKHTLSPILIIFVAMLLLLTKGHWLGYHGSAKHTVVQGGWWFTLKCCQIL